MRILREKIGAEPKFFVLSLLFFLLFASGFFLSFITSEFTVLFLHLGLFFMGFSFVYENNLKKTIEKLSGKIKIKKIAVYVIAGIIGIVLYMLLLGYLSVAFNFNDSGNISETVEQFTPLLIFAAIFIGPFSEEIFFRGFLTGRFGIVISSVIFALAHIAYGSLIEILGAFGIGIILAYVFKRSKSLIPCILIHFLFNLFSLSLYYWLV